MAKVSGQHLDSYSWGILGVGGELGYGRRTIPKLGKHMAHTPRHMRLSQQMSLTQLSLSHHTSLPLRFKPPRYSSDLCLRFLSNHLSILSAPSSMASESVYGFIGIGQMGWGMAMNLREKLPMSTKLIICEVSVPRREAFIAEAGLKGVVEIVETPRQLAEVAVGLSAIPPPFLCKRSLS